MRISKITALLFLLLSGICFSQEQKLIHGKVSYQSSYQKNVDVINFSTKRLSQTNTQGEFDIEAKVGDALIFLSDNFADQKYILTKEDFEKPMLVIKLADIPIPLQEIEIQQLSKIKIELSQNDLKMARLQKGQGAPKVQGVYTGEIENGMDFVAIGKMIGKLFKNKNPQPKKPEENIGFKAYAKANFNESFFTKTLKVKPSDTARFLDFCEADPKSKKVIESNDEMAILEFLLVKKAEFDKLK